MIEEKVPIVSVIMGVYNGKKYLREAVQSVLNQTFRDFEFIIVDDASTDTTKKILEEFTDPRIRILTNPQNEGLTRCLIKGCNEARGTYIARMDADDISYPQRFEMQIEFLDGHPEYAVVGTQCHFLDRCGNVRGKSEFFCIHEEIQRDILRRAPFVHGSTMFRREAFIACGGYREFFRYAQDYDLWLRLIEKCRMSNLPAIYYGYRYHLAAITLDKLPLQEFFFDLARQFAEKRAVNGFDPIIRGDNSYLLSELKRYNSGTFFDKMATRSKAAIQLLEFMVVMGKFSDVLYLWLKAVINNPFNSRVWQMLSYGIIRIRLKNAIVSRCSNAR